MNGGFGFDISPLVKRAKEHSEKQRAVVLRAVDHFGDVRILGDAQTLAPVGGGSHSPNDPAPGTLVASATSEPAALNGTKIEKKLGFNTEYAAVQHEDLSFGHDVGQAKYLETALRRNVDELGPYVAEKMKAAE